jgi:spermidine/putrescine transport system substrate-binding protein
MSDSDNHDIRPEEASPIYLSRRSLVHRAIGIGLGAIALEPLVNAAAAAGAPERMNRVSTSQASETLNILTWETYDDQPWLDDFAKKTGITVHATNVGSPAEMFAKTKANPSQYDIVYATSGWFDNYVQSNLLMPIDESRVKNSKELKLGFNWRAATSVQGKNYAILYNWGDQPLGWLPNLVPGNYNISKYLNRGVPDDWNVLWDPQFKGKVSIFDDPTSVEPMIPLALGFKDPYHLNDQQFKAFSKKLFELRPQVKRLTSGFNDQTNQFASGEAIIGYINNIASVVALKKAGHTLAINNLVKQGTPAWSDNMAITKEGGAKKLDAVYEFINESLSIPWQARFIATSGNSGTLNYDQATSAEARRAGLRKPQLAATLIPATRAGKAFFSKMIFFQSVENLQKRLDLWNQFKLGIH